MGEIDIFAEDFNDDLLDNYHGYLELMVYPVRCPVMATLKGKYEFNSFQKTALELTDPVIKDDIKKAILDWDAPVSEPCNLDNV